jgi:hypothetical protein
MDYTTCRTHGFRSGYPGVFRGECDLCEEAKVERFNNPNNCPSCGHAKDGCPCEMLTDANGELQ